MRNPTIKQPTLVWSARPNNPDVLIYSIDEATSSLIENIFNKKRKLIRTDRIEFRHGKLHYKPSNEYREYIVRLKKIK